MGRRYTYLAKNGITFKGEQSSIYEWELNSEQDQKEGWYSGRITYWWWINVKNETLIELGETFDRLLRKILVKSDEKIQIDVKAENEGKLNCYGEPYMNLIVKIKTYVSTLDNFLYHEVPKAIERYLSQWIDLHPDEALLAKLCATRRRNEKQKLDANLAKIREEARLKIREIEQKLSQDERELKRQYKQAKETNILDSIIIIQRAVLAWLYSRPSFIRSQMRGDWS